MPGWGTLPLGTVAAQAGLRTLRPTRPLDLRRTLGPVRRGARDPTFRALGEDVWRATRTPAGPATQRLSLGRDGTLTVEAWGPGSEWLLDRAPALVGELDRAAGFRPRHPLLREVWRRHPGLRMCRTEAVFEASVATVLEQKVK